MGIRVSKKVSIFYSESSGSVPGRGRWCIPVFGGIAARDVTDVADVWETGTVEFRTG